MTEPLRVGVRCDAGASTGAGHVMRCVALAEEMLQRGWSVIFLSDLGGLEFPARQLATRGLPVLAAPTTPAEHLAAVSTHSLDAIVLDSYTLAPAVSGRLVAAGIPVLAIVDGTLRDQSAHLYLDQNIGAERDEVPLPVGATRCAGLHFSLQRDAVRRLRPPSPWHPRGGGPPRVLVAFGGTDAYGVTEVMVRGMLAAGVAFDATVVVPDPAVRARIAGLDAPGTRISAVGPAEDYPALLAGADLVLGAAGVSVSEYCCLGRPAAVMAVADNQVPSYDRLVALGAVLGLGTLSAFRGEAAELGGLLAAALHGEQRRAAVASVAHGLVDGDGRVRVVEEFDRVVAGVGRGLTVRR